jgi:hypothetical protein
MQVYQLEYTVQLPAATGGRELHCVCAVAARRDVLYTMTALAPAEKWSEEGARWVRVAGGLWGWLVGVACGGGLWAWVMGRGGRPVLPPRTPQSTASEHGL